MTNIAQIDLNDKSIDGVLGIRTRGSTIIGADESTELWRHPREDNLFKWTKVLLMSFLPTKRLQNASIRLDLIPCWLTNDVILLSWIHYFIERGREGDETGNVTRLGDFRKFLATNSLTKVAQKDC